MEILSEGRRKNPGCELTSKIIITTIPRNLVVLESVSQICLGKDEKSLERSTTQCFNAMVVLQEAQSLMCFAQ